MFPEVSNQETLIQNILFPQHFFLICRGLLYISFLSFRCARRFREKYKPFEYKELNDIESGKTSKVTPEQNSSNPTPQAPPPPALNWRPIPRVEPVLPMVLPSSPQPKQNVWKHTNVKHQMQMANNLFMDELLKAFKTFNVDANNKIGNPSEKRPP